jgi:hypothetical protein
VSGTAQCGCGSVGATASWGFGFRFQLLHHAFKPFSTSLFLCVGRSCQCVVVKDRDTSMQRVCEGESAEGRSRKQTSLECALGPVAVTLRAALIVRWAAGLPIPCKCRCKSCLPVASTVSLVIFCPISSDAARTWPFRNQLIVRPATAVEDANSK